MGARSAVMAVTSRSFSEKRQASEKPPTGAAFRLDGWLRSYGVPIQRPIRDRVRDQAISVARARRFSTGTGP